jgi:hypothetical protein
MQACAFYIGEMRTNIRCICVIIRFSQQSSVSLHLIKVNAENSSVNKPYEMLLHEEDLLFCKSIDTFLESQLKQSFNNLRKGGVQLSLKKKGGTDPS